MSDKNIIDKLLNEINSQKSLCISERNMCIKKMYRRYSLIGMKTSREYEIINEISGEIKAYNYMIYILTKELHTNEKQ